MAGRSEQAGRGDSIGIEGPDIIAPSRFAVNAQATGSFRPGQPVHISSTVRATLDTDDAEISFRLPEVAAALQSRWDVVDLPLGVPVRPAASWQKRMRRGQEARQAVTVTIPEPGYYMVIATAAAQPGAEDRGALFQNVSHQELWLWISEEGGRVTDTFDPSLFPEGARQQPGPLSFKKDPARMIPRRPSAPAQGSLLSTMSAAGPATVVATYWNPTTYAVDPLPKATVSYAVYSGYGEHLYSRVALTDANGAISIPCEYDETVGYGSYYGAVYTRNGDVQVEPSMAGTFSGNFAADCGATRQVAVGWKVAHVFAIMNRSIEVSRNFFGYARGHLMVWIESGVTNSYYVRSEDYVVIMDAPGGTHIGGPDGDFVVAHEFGHAMHHKALGGNTGGGCPSTHQMSGAYNLGCAFSEGFANYHAVVAMDSYIRTGLEANLYYPGQYGSGDRRDGSIIEGAVAAFLYDLTDDANEPHDQARYPGRYVADMIRTCQTYWYPWFNPDWKRANGVDHLVTCFERAIPGYSVYFKSRDPDPIGFREYASEPYDWNASHVRRLWKKNLYNLEDTGGTGGDGGGDDDPPPPPADDCTVDPTVPC